MRTGKLLVASFGLAAALAGVGRAGDIEYADFSSTAGLTLNGDCAVSGGAVLRLVPDVSGKWGSAFTTSPITLTPDGTFSTSFSFRITDDGQGNKADGLAFVLQRDSRGSAALGAGGGNMGYGDDKGSLDILPSLAVEFDPFWLVLPTEPSGTHVGIDLNGNMASVAAALTPASLANGLTKYAWVDYSGASSQMKVYLSESPTKPASALLTYSTDLVSILGDNTGVYAGFSAATGGERAAHDVLSWGLDVPPPPAPKVYSVLIGPREIKSNLLFTADYRGDLDAQRLGAAIAALPNAVDPCVVLIDSTTPNAHDLAMQRIQQVAARCGPDDTLVVFIGGHGSANGSVAIQLDAAGDTFATINRNELTGWLDGMNQVNKVVALPGCHTGSFWQGTTPTDRGLSALSRVGLLAGAPADEDSFMYPHVPGADDEDYVGMTPMAITLIEALQAGAGGRTKADLNGDGSITFAELESFVLSANTYDEWSWFQPFVTNFQGWDSLAGQTWPVLSEFGDVGLFEYSPDLPADVLLERQVVSQSAPEPATLALLGLGGLALLRRARHGRTRGSED